MGFAVLIAVLLIVGAVAGIVVQRRSVGPYAGPVPESEEKPEEKTEAAAPETSVAPDGDAEAQARLWSQRLGGSLATLYGALDSALGAKLDRTAAQALADAAERRDVAVALLPTAATAAQYAEVTRTAVEGLHYVRAARTALGLDPPPALPDLGTPQITARDGRVIVTGETYAVSYRRGEATPYYYPGGTLAGRRLPGGWYSRAWWRAPLATTTAPPATATVGGEQAEPAESAEPAVEAGVLTAGL
ncbi:hypothetical protein OK074_3293 [Actinobacteria bacterium OK074]|nr:hypothetical protein OK074_3293 [Actinobacteria bacterium OK074]